MKHKRFITFYKFSVTVIMVKLDGGVTAAKGYKAASAAAGIKYKDRDDMALVYSEVPAVCAGTFTTNVVKASPVKWDMEIVKSGKDVRAVVLNSGIANACTGAEGDATNLAMAESVAAELGIEANEVLTASTGVIGMPIPVDRVKEGAKLLAKNLDSTPEAATSAAKAIMTTDTVKKEYVIDFEIDGKTVTIGGMTKGSGMIHPNMATMLCVLTTDLSIEKSLLQEAMSEVVKESFNMISVDRDTSTNDTFVILANGMAGNDKITEKDDNYNTFLENLRTISVELAKIMAADGEGASKLFETKVINADTKENAITLAKSVITSNLVKTAVYGSDANWGRIICAMGYSGAEFDPENVDLYIESKDGKILIFTNGKATDYSEEEATKILSAEEVTAIADMKSGTESATAWGCDLTYEYVRINGDYRS